MKIRILGTESLGVRGLSCVVEAGDRKIFIDPGVSLGWSRYGFLPHPFQIALGMTVRERIIGELRDCTDVVISHFHGDHCPLKDPNPYQLAAQQVDESLSRALIHAIGTKKAGGIRQKRREELEEIIGKEILTTEGVHDGPLAFSFGVPHGEHGGAGNRVMMTRVQAGGRSFVHASDIQYYDGRTVRRILEWEPDIVLSSGPPLYQFDPAAQPFLEHNARENALRLSKGVKTLIIDHHVLRSARGIEWLDELRAAAENTVLCAADFMGRERIFPEAWRHELYAELPVPRDWHKEYVKGTVIAESYREAGWEYLINSGRVRPCKWYRSCSLGRYTEAGKLEHYWVENYCLVRNRHCKRYQMEEKGEYHPDNMMPDGSIREDLGEGEPAET